MNPSIERKVAIDYGFIGLGGAGGKLAESFSLFGKYKSVSLNISSQDLSKIKLEDDNKLHLDLGFDGAGKDMSIGADAVSQFTGEIHQLISSKFSKDQYLMVCAGGGGGTGCGGILKLIDLCREHTTNVGCVFTLPKDTEGEKVRHNTYKTLVELYKYASEGKLSPLVLVDNGKIADIHQDWNIINWYKLANSEITTLFHQINVICSQDSEVHAFDPADYKTLMTSGKCLIFGSLDIPTENITKTSISTHMRENLTSGLLARGFEKEYINSKMAGAILVGQSDVLGGIPMEYLEMSFGVLNRMIGDGTVHRGIYVQDKHPLRIYTMIGNLSLPESISSYLSK